MTELVYEWDSEDLARLDRALSKLDEEDLARPMYYEIGSTIHKAAGVYPQWTDSPPYPYYIRGRGTQYSESYNDQRSENLRERWWVKVFPHYLKVGNAASYAGWVHGEEQTETHKKHGWKKLLDTAKKEMPGIIKKLEARALKLWEQTR